ncbi:AbrB family transcriptional regulator [Pseudoflavonifractor sp. 60]|uniref:AbrB family transcriptional regulator n=1 Tax=Pseudoflavonifractor sp. 60 TaxID=2304576 RepID=UPI00136C6C75|nr:AbrB family transcriptional regulator [Pseudoflavonifractor sp. 60]NBI68510.1 AbrB family transcriptional regulator [Pseudoflavonifractor sp. 60]
MWMILTILVASVTGFCLLKLRVPGGMLVGAIIGAAALSLITQKAFIYPETRILAQSLTGAYIGCMVTRQDVCHLPKLIKPYLLVMGSLLALNICMGIAIYALTDFDLLTCLFCAAPGGVSDTPLIAMDVGADASIVAVMQFVRMLFGMGCLPSIILLSDRMIEPGHLPQQQEGTQSSPSKSNADRKPTLIGFLPVFSVALAAGTLGKCSGMPAGTMSAALIVTAAINISGKCSGMPMWLRRVAQVISGCCIGSGIMREQVLRMRQMILPAVLLCLGYIVCCIGVGYIMSKLFHIELRESMLTLSPAGATEMALIAADLGVESANLVVLQLCRLVGVMVLFPHIFRLIVTVFG